MGAAGRDVGELLARFEAVLAGRGTALADRAALFELAGAAVRRAAVSLARLPIVLLDVAVTSPAERRFVAALAAESPSILATVPAGDERTREALLELGARADSTVGGGRGYLSVGAATGEAGPGPSASPGR